MGWFSSDYKTVAGISFVSLKGDAFKEYPTVFKNIVASANFDVPVIGEQLIRYKKDYRKNINQRIVDRYNLTIQDLFIFKEDTQDLKNSIAAHNNGLAYLTDYTDVITTATIDILTPPYPPAQTIPIHDYQLRQWKIAEKLISLGGTITGYQAVSPYAVIYTAANTPPTGYWAYSNGSMTASIGDTLSSFTFTVYDPGFVVPLAVFTNINTTTVDARPYQYAQLQVVRTGTGNIEYKFVDRQYVEDSIYGVESPLSNNSFAPNFLFNDPVRSENDTKRLIELFGGDYDSTKEMAESPNLETVRIGYFLSPDVISYHKNVCKYFYNFFFDISVDEPNDNLASNLIIHNSVGNFDITIRFSCIKKENQTTEIALFTGGLLKEWEVRVRATIPDSTRYYDDLKALYDAKVGGGSTDVTVMYNDLYAWTYSSPTNDDKLATRSSMPPATVKRNTLPTKRLHAYCVEADIATVLHTKLFDGATEAFTVVDYKERKNIILDTPSFEDYYYKRSVDGDGYVVYEVYKRLSATTYNKVTFSRGSINYVDGNVPATVNYGDQKDETFRIPVLWSALSSDNSFREYVTIYDNSLCASMYAVQTIEIKWYQTAAFALVLRVLAVVVAVVIAVASAGAGTPIATTLLNLAINLAVAYAISLAINFVGDSIGGDLGQIFKAVAVLVVAVYSGDITEASSLFLKASDEFLKYKNYKIQEDTEEVQKQNKVFVEEINALIRDVDSLNARFESDIFPETIIDLMKKSTDSNDAIMNLDTDVLKQLFDSIEANDWKLAEVKPPDFLDDYSTYFDPTLDIPRGVTEFEGQITSFQLFGDDTIIDIDT